MERRNQPAKRAALLSWWDRGSTEAKARRNRPALEHLESRRLLATMAEFPVPSGTASAPDGIVSVPKGDMWFTEFGSDKIGTIDPTTHAISEFPIPTPNAEPLQIALGPDGNLWFTEFGASQIGMINPTTDKITEFPLSPGAQPFGITAGPNNTIWFTEWSGNQIGTLNITSGKITTHPIPTSDSVPEGITLGSDGTIWFTEALGNNIGMINTKDNNALTEIPVPTPGAEPYAITAGPGGNLWFTEYGGNKIGMYSPSASAFSEYTIPTASTEPTEIVADSEGNLWFTQSKTNEVGEFSPATQGFTEIAPPTAGSGPRGITARGDGAVWFTELNVGEIARIAPRIHLVVTTPPPTTLNPGAPLGLTVTVEFDGSGAVDTGYQGSITATAIGATSAGGSALAGTTSVMPTNGVATFTGLSLNEAGTYTIQVNTADTSPVSVGAVVVTSPVVSSPVNPPPKSPTAPIPIVTSEKLVMAGSGSNRYVAGIVLSFSSPLDPASARDIANYTVIQVPKSGQARAIKAVRLRAVYKPSGKTVRLSLSGRPRFAAGGQLIVYASKPNGITSPAGVPLEGNTGGYAGANGLYTILPDARGISS